MRSQRTGFTLIELLVVIAIIAILAAILFPVFARAQEDARRAKCTSNMHQVNVALLMYTDDNYGRFPDSPGMFFCMMYSGGPKAPPPYQGPYVQDCLRNHVRNNDVWLCPDYRPNMLVPAGPGGAYNGYRFRDNTGRIATKAYSNYIWNHQLPGSNDPSINLMRVSGSPVSLIKHPTFAMTFLEFPYWYPCPHAIANPRLVYKGAWPNAASNVVFYDGHTRLINSPDHAYALLSPQGWKSVPDWHP